MKRFIASAILTAAMLTGATPSARAQDAAPPKPVTITADTSYRSVYDSNGGLFFSEGPIVQQIVTGCKGDICITLWNGYDMKQEKHNETDFIFEYTHERANKSKIKAGYIDMELFPQDGAHSNTQEAFIGYITPRGLDLRLCRHLNQSSGIVLKGTQSKQLGPIVLTGTIGHNHHYWTFDKEGRDGSGNYGALSAAVPLNVKAGITLTPTVSCQKGTGTLEDRCWGSIGVTYTPGQ